MKACEKRPVSTDTLENIVNEIEREIYNKFDREVTTSFVGSLVMQKLRVLDMVAYVRFASVYREFKDISEFIDELKPLMTGVKKRKKRWGAATPAIYLFNIRPEGKRGMNTTATTEYVLKRDGRKVPFNEKKIADAIFKAAQAVGGEDRALADELSVVVSMFLEKKYAGQTPGIEDIQDIVEKVLIETGHAKTAKAYILYRDKRARSRESLCVRKQTKKRADTTDVSLLVNTETKDETFPWDKRKIAEALEKEADLSEEVSGEIAGTVEQRVFPPD